MLGDKTLSVVLDWVPEQGKMFLFLQKALLGQLVKSKSLY